MKKSNHFLFVSAIASVLLLGAGCSTTPPAPAPQASAPVGQTNVLPSAASAPAKSQVAATIANFSFQPSSSAVAVGGTVTWTNNDSMPHTVTADDGSFNSGPISPGTTFSHTFSTPGTVSYHCSFHPSMHGSIVVQ